MRLISLSLRKNVANSVKEWTYEAAGVPHLKGDPSYNKKIVQLIRSTHTPGVLGSATGFAALFDFKKAGVKDPLLVSSTDGVGTKLEIARLQNKHDTIGIDLVAMCVNDLITCGAKPLFFLDYYATGKFDPEATAKVLKESRKAAEKLDVRWWAVKRRSCRVFIKTRSLREKEG